MLFDGELVAVGVVRINPSVIVGPVPVIVGPARQPGLRLPTSGSRGPTRERFPTASESPTSLPSPILTSHGASCRGAPCGGGVGERTRRDAGNATRKVEPTPTSLSTVSSPPSRARIPWQMDRPSPLPEPTGLVVKNGSSACASTSGAPNSRLIPPRIPLHVPPRPEFPPFPPRIYPPEFPPHPSYPPEWNCFAATCSADGTPRTSAPVNLPGFAPISGMLG